MKQGYLNADLSDIKLKPSAHTGKLYIFGGIIVKTTVQQDGSLLEAVFVPVDCRRVYCDARREDWGNGIQLPFFRDKRNISLERTER
jgi:starvation-inducible outer membrane lipoprotein